MKRLFYSFTFVLFYILILSSEANAGAIATAAAGLAPRQWTMLTNTQIPGLDLTAQQYVQGAGGIFYDGIQPMWDSTALRLYMEMTEHATADFNNCASVSPPLPHTCWKNTWQYNESNSTFTIMSVYPKYSNGNHVNGAHSYTHVAWDDVNKVGYVRKYYSGEATNEYFRFCANNTPSYCATQGAGQWAQIASLSPNSEEGSGQTMVWQPNLNGGTLLYFSGSGNSAGCGRLMGFRETGGTGTWAVVDDGAGCKFSGQNAYGLGVYSAVKGVAVFGGGQGATGSTHFWRIGASGGPAVAIDNAPCPVSVSNGSYGGMAPDPLSGNIILIGCTVAGQLWELNPTGAAGSQWTLIDGNLAGPNEICNISHQTENCSAYHVPIPISTYGVIAYWKYRNTTPETAELWIYKHTASGGGDVTAPTVSLTAPAAGTVSGNVTVSATASDNIGVAGVQFKVDGVATGAEDTTAPFSISWDSTAASNGNHTLTATARDAAGNSATSTGVVVNVSNGGQDFNTRCKAAGVVLCVSFDDQSEINCTSPSYCNHGLDINNATVLPVLDTTVKASGNSSLKFTIGPKSGANGAGAYLTNFDQTNALSKQYGAGDVLYIQWRQRFSPEFLNTQYFLLDSGGTQLAGGWKQISVTSGDQPGTCPPMVAGQVANSQYYCVPGSVSPAIANYSSCTPIDVPVQNTNQRGFAQAYNSCYGSQTHTSYAGFVRQISGFIDTAQSTCGPTDCYLQDSRPLPYCLYSQTYSSFFSPTGNCFGYAANEWMTFKVKLTIGTRTCVVTPGSPVDHKQCEFANSHFDMWIGREGQPTQRVFDFGPYPLSALNMPCASAGCVTDTDPNEKFGKIYLLPYHSYKDDTQVTPTGYTWYDDLIISTQDIADPNATPDTTNPTVAITSPIPPTASSTTSPIAVSGTASDNISVTSVTWTCIACVTKGGTATSSPGTSISWLIPALSFPAAGSYTLNVVAHDAAGNVSTAATLVITYAPLPIRIVTKAGTDSGNCSVTACLTIHYAITQAVASDTIEIRDSGVYAESWEGPTVAPFGTASNYTTIRGAAGQRPIIRPPGGACFIFLFAGSVNHYIELNNLKLDGVNLNNCGALVKITDSTPGDGAHHIRLNNVQVTALGNAHETDPMDNANSHHMGVLGGGTGLEILNSEIDHVVYCLYWGGDNAVVDHVNCHDTTGYGFHFYTDTAGAVHDNMVRYSLIENIGKYMSATYHCVSGLLFANGNSNIAHDNIIRGPTGASGSPANDCGSGFQLDLSGNNSQIYNNTVYATQNGLYLGPGLTATVRNNIFWASTRTSDLYNAGTLTQDHNLCATVTGTSACSQTADPQFNGAPGDLTLASKSPARNNGVDTAYAVDYAGAPRSSPWDIGAYEGSVIIPPIVTIINPTSNPTLGVTSPLFSLGGTSNLP